jgi:hypothetical protein
MDNPLDGLYQKSNRLEIEKRGFDTLVEHIDGVCTKFLERFNNAIMIRYENGELKYLFNRRCELDITILKQCLGKILQEELNIYNKPIVFTYYNDKYDCMCKSEGYNFNGLDPYILEDVLIRTLNQYMKQVK